MTQMNNESAERHCPDNAMYQHLCCRYIDYEDKIQRKYTPEKEGDKRGYNAIARLFLGRLYSRT